MHKAKRSIPTYLHFKKIIKEFKYCFILTYVFQKLQSLFVRQVFSLQTLLVKDSNPTIFYINTKDHHGPVIHRLKIIDLEYKLHEKRRSNPTSRGGKINQDKVLMIIISKKKSGLNNIELYFLLIKQSTQEDQGCIITISAKASQ